MRTHHLVVYWDVFVAWQYKVPTVYTAHGFHFFKDGSKSSWFVFFPIEWIFSFVTDTLITINEEDFSSEIYAC